MLNKAGAPCYTEIILVADNLGEAAVSYVIFRLMGFADVKVQAPWCTGQYFSGARPRALTVWAREFG